MKKVFALLLILLLPAFVYAESNTVSIEQKGRKVSVKRGGKTIFKIGLGSRDDAFLAGSCTIVRRNVRPTELFPTVERIEAFLPNGDKKVYTGEKPVDVRHIDGSQAFSSPDQKWAVVMDQEEGMYTGFVLVFDDCDMKPVRFQTGPADVIQWAGELNNGSFNDASTFVLTSLSFETTNQPPKPVKIEIRKNGKYMMSDAQPAQSKQGE